MARNEAGPFIVRIPYTVEGISHIHSINVLPDDRENIEIGDPNINLLSKGGTAIPLATAVDAYWEVARVFIPFTALASTWELWRAKSGETIPPMWFAGGVLDPVGGSGNVVYNAGTQLTLTYRSNAGGLLKFVFMEGTYGDVRRPISSALNSAENNFTLYVTGNSSIVYSRSNGYPAAPLSYAGGENEATWRKRFRG